MSEIRQYILVDESDNEGTAIYSDYDEALEDARRYGHAVVAQVYEYTDSELVWTPDGGDTWPPEASGTADPLKHEFIPDPAGAQCCAAPSDDDPQMVCGWQPSEHPGGAR